MSNYYACVYDSVSVAFLTIGALSLTVGIISLFVHCDIFPIISELRYHVLAVTLLVLFFFIFLLFVLRHYII